MIISIMDNIYIYTMIFLYFDQSPFFSPIGCSMTAVKSAWIWPCAASISSYFNCSYGKNGSEWLENQLLIDLGQGLMVSSSLPSGELT